MECHPPPPTCGLNVEWRALSPGSKPLHDGAHSEPTRGRNEVPHTGRIVCTGGVRGGLSKEVTVHGKLTKEPRGNGHSERWGARLAGGAAPASRERGWKRPTGLRRQVTVAAD